MSLVIAPRREPVALWASCSGTKDNYETQFEVENTMLTKEENNLLTRVGPGTPGGELLRRYWYPIAVAKELTDENPTQFIRILGEDLVLFKDKKGRVGLVADRCPHRGASLLYGRVVPSRPRTTWPGRPRGPFRTEPMSVWLRQTAALLC